MQKTGKVRKLMNCKESVNWKKVSKEMEEKLLKMMKQKHLKRLSVMQYINDMQITGKEKACLLGSMKNFENLLIKVNKRTKSLKK